MASRPEYKWQPRPVTRQAYLAWRVEVQAKLVAERELYGENAPIYGPVHRESLKKARQVAASGAVSTGDGHIVVGPPRGGDDR